MKSRAKDVGIYRPRHTWRFTGDVRFKKTRMMVLDAAGLDGFVREARARGQAHRLHERRLRSPAPRPRPLPAGGARPRRRADRRPELPTRRSAATRAPSGPINPGARARRSARRALACVDAVSIFDEDTPADIIRRVQPDILRQGRRLARRIRSSAETRSRHEAAG